MIIVYDIDYRYTLKKYLETDKIPEAILTEIGLKIIYLIKFMHLKGFLINTLPTTNVVYDPFSKDISLISIRGIAGIRNHIQPQYEIVLPGSSSPEYWQGLQTDEKSDIFCIGIFILEWYIQISYSD